jgi:hypothetical protein
MKHYIAFAVLLMSCGDKEGSAPPPLSNGEPSDEETCGGTSPVIQSVTCENSGLQDHPDYGEDIPTFSLYVNATDEDNDLTYYELFIDIDSELNGEKDSDAIELSSVQGALSDGTCDVNETNVGVTIYLRSGPPSFDTTYEWHVQISDALGDISDTTTVVCTTPNADGEGTP